MNQQLRDLQQASGATFTDGTVTPGRFDPVSFGHEAVVMEALAQGVAVCDRSSWGRIEVLGGDRIRFLHNQTTNNFQILQPGQGCDTVFVTSTGRTIDLATAYVTESSVLMLVSPGYAQKLIDWMDRYIFFADKVELKDVTESTATFSVLGGGSDRLLEQLGLGAIAGQTPASHQVLDLQGISVRVAVGSGLTTPGYTLMVADADAAQVWQRLTEVSAIPMGSETWERLRIEQGRPVPGQELTEEINPLEAGLWQTISLSKGCYIGQETIARLHTYRGVKQQLWGIRLQDKAEPNSPIQSGEEKIGTLTSVIAIDQGFLGLGYIRTKAVAAGLKVQVNGVAGELVPVPFVSHEYP
ncbi:MAG: folate-binding protein [Oculatellaceae cyanobacterium Prado106]|jgi:hypothetical protein|nr:folate-binding protein [Oculatellaceae cyanobacterium Prado106]